MKVLRKKPQQKWERIEIENTLEALQNEVGGYIETVSFIENACLVVNEEGVFNDLKFNITFLGHQLFGTILLVGVDGEEFSDIPKELAEFFLEEKK